MSRSVALAVLLLVVGPSVASAVIVIDLGVPPVRMTAGSSSVNDVHVQNQTVNFDGSTAYEIVVVANSSRTVDVEAVVTVSLETLHGRVVADGQAMKLLTATGTETYVVDVIPNVTRSEYAMLNVTVRT